MNAQRLLAIGILLIFVITPLISFHVTVNSSTYHPTPTDPLRIACVGDSITQNTGYPTDLQSIMSSNFTVGNFGVAGSTVIDSSYKPYMQQPQFQSAEQFMPNIVVVMLGTNDAHYDTEQLESSTSFDGDYDQLINSFQALPTTPQIFVVEPPPVFNNSIGISPVFFNSTIIPDIQNVANSQNVSKIDVYDSFGNNPDLTIDGIHPNTDGASLIANQVSESIITQDNLSAYVPSSDGSASGPNSS